MKKRFFVGAPTFKWAPVLTALFALSMAAAPCVNAQAKQKTRVAVFPFEVTDYAVNASEAVTIREDFSNRLAQTGLFDLVPRSEVDKLFKQEAAFQLNDLSDATKTAEYGRVLNANWILAGRLAKIGSRLALVVSMYTYPDFVQKPGSQIYAPDIDTLVDSIPTLIADIQSVHGGGGAAPAAGKAAAAKSATQPQAKPAAPKTYKIGDTGPAGGFIFFDKFSNDGGWRYLEAAPVSMEQTLGWGAGDRGISGLKTTVGTGKKNTEYIAEVLKRVGEYGAAAQYCAGMEYGGYDDWFLPSKDELNLMYLNLKQADKGDFSNAVYWSSSESYTFHAWYQRFRDGSQDWTSKSNTFLVRPVRAF
ncbi:MAG: DUF1566 domain-containing protein [Treponema sp.]|jgi:TolB-like protein|nr:DUF1566 domain-containing protein [Treponema sp.]